MLDIIYILGTVGAIIAGISNYFSYRATYKKVKYTEYSSDNTDPWRWRKPSEELGVFHTEDCKLIIKDGENISCLLLRQRTPLGDYLANLMGYACVGLSLFLVVNILTRMPDGYQWSLIGCLFPFGLGSLLLNVNSQVLQIDLHPDSLVLTTKYALFRYREHRYKPHKRFKVKGENQSFLTMDDTQDEPDYRLEILKPVLGLFATRKIFTLCCNKTQGSWIVEGLKYWNEIAITSDS